MLSFFLKVSSEFSSILQTKTLMMTIPPISILVVSSLTPLRDPNLEKGSL